MKAMKTLKMYKLENIPENIYMSNEFRHAFLYGSRLLSLEKFCIILSST
jgi:hypothetical protein